MKVFLFSLMSWLPPKGVRKTEEALVRLDLSSQTTTPSLCEVPAQVDQAYVLWPYHLGFFFVPFARPFWSKTKPLERVLFGILFIYFPSSWRDRVCIMSTTHWHRIRQPTTTRGFSGRVIEFDPFFLFFFIRPSYSPCWLVSPRLGAIKNRSFPRLDGPLPVFQAFFFPLVVVAPSSTRQGCAISTPRIKHHSSVAKRSRFHPRLSPPAVFNASRVYRGLKSGSR